MESFDGFYAVYVFVTEDIVGILILMRKYSTHVLIRIHPVIPNRGSIKYTEVIIELRIFTMEILLYRIRETSQKWICRT